MTITFLAPDGVAVTAQQFRQAQAATHGGGAGRRLGGRSGFRVDTPSTVLTATSTTWTLGPCAAMIDPGATTHQGVYGWSSDANVTGTVTAADATYARKDIVYIQVNDSSAGDGSGALTANVLYLAGVAAASPVAPSLPARSFLVGTISVPVSGGGSPTVALNPARFAAAGGILPVFSQDEADALVKYDGLPISRIDLTGAPIRIASGTKWVGPPRGQLSTVSNAGAAATGTTLNVILESTVTVEPDRIVRVTAQVEGSSDTSALHIAYHLKAGGTGTGGTGLRSTTKRYSAASLGEGVPEFSGRYSTGVGGSVRFSLQAQVTVTAGVVSHAAGNATLTVDDLGPA